MLTRFFTPKRIMAIMAGEALLLAGLILAPKLGLAQEHSYAEDLISLGFGVVARLVACELFLYIANEYRNVRLSRMAWQALAIHSLLLLVRGVATTGAMDLLVTGYYRSPLRGFLNNGLGIPANVFLVLGLLGLLHSYRSAGFRPPLGWRHCAVMTGAVLLFGWMLVFHQRLEQGHSPWMINRLLQPAELLFAAAASIISIVLHRYASTFSGGKLAEAIRWLVIYGLLSGALVLIMQVVVPTIQHTLNLNLWPFIRLWAFVPWIMALAAVVRAQMTVSAVAQVAELQRAKRFGAAPNPVR